MQMYTFTEQNSSRVSFEGVFIKILGSSAEVWMWQTLDNITGTWMYFCSFFKCIYHIMFLKITENVSNGTSVYSHFLTNQFLEGYQKQNVR